MEVSREIAALYTAEFLASTLRNFWLTKIIIASQIQLLIYLHSTLGPAYNEQFNL